MSYVPRFLFLCTGNSARSQMAEAWLRHLGLGRFEAHSAGTQPRSEIHPLTRRVMEEAGMDLSGQSAKSVELYLGESFDHVITVCDGAHDACPTFPGEHQRTHWSLPDPAPAGGTEEERHRAFVEARDEIRRRVADFVAAHTES